MGHYHYDGDEYCEACVPGHPRNLKRRKGKKGDFAFCCQCHASLDGAPHYHLDGDDYCDDCKPEYPPHVDLDDGEQDSPANCCVCHRPLDYRLTSDGVEYVLEAIRESLREGKAARDTVHPCYDGTYYEGSPHCDIVRDWANDLRGYCLSERDQRLVDLYLYRTKRHDNRATH